MMIIDGVDHRSLVMKVQFIDNDKNDIEVLTCIGLIQGPYHVQVAFQDLQFIVHHYCTTFERRTAWKTHHYHYHQLDLKCWVKNKRNYNLMGQV